MKRIIAALFGLGFIVLVACLPGGEDSKGKSPNGIQVAVEDRNPWTHLRLNDDPENFHFAIVSDRTGSHRARIFSEAVDRLNLMQPAFVVSVGDLIEGYTKEQDKLASQWKELQTYVSRLEMPFFYVPGNHDMQNPVEAKVWQERFGRSYYHFPYRNTLFLMLKSDDPSEEEGGGKIGKDQLEYVKKALADNAKVRWTFVFMHKPIWTLPNLEKSGWLEVEKLLADRPYTVFVGHIHQYRKFVRQGRNYYQLATTGGRSKLRGVPYGEFDHFVWVTMKKDGPVLSNILLNGIYPEDLKPMISPEEGSEQIGHKPLLAARGTVQFKGAPAAGAVVGFFSDDKATKEAMFVKKGLARVADSVVGADGSFVPSTYKGFDGLPAGEYTVTVTWHVPLYDQATGKPGPNKLPEKYAAIATSELRAQVKAGQPNVFNFNLMP